MADLIQQIKNWNGKVVITGIGSVERGDDAAGIYVVKNLRERELNENICVRICDSDSSFFRLCDCSSGIGNDSIDNPPEHVIFIDAVEFGGNAGDIILLESDEIKARFPQISTHKISLSTIAKFIETNGKTRVWLIGIQPKRMADGISLSADVIRSADLLIELLAQQFGVDTPTMLNTETRNYVQS